jgi:hypothetical protein
MEADYRVDPNSFLTPHALSRRNEFSPESETQFSFFLVGALVLRV